MTDLTAAERSTAKELASRGYGYQDIPVRMERVFSRIDAIWLKAMVLRQTWRKPIVPEQFAAARERRRRRPAPVKSSAPITLPTVSLCGND